MKRFTLNEGIACHDERRPGGGGSRGDPTQQDQLVILKPWFERIDPV